MHFIAENCDKFPNLVLFSPISGKISKIFQKFVHVYTGMTIVGEEAGGFLGVMCEKH